MDQLTWSTPFVPAGGLPTGTDQLASEWIAVGQVRDTMPCQDRSNCACGNTQLSADPVRSTSLLAPHLQDLGFDLDRGAGRRPPRPRRAIVHASGTLAAVPRDPAMGALARDAELFRDVCHWSTQSQNPFDQ
jgi:hypothetical protein